MKKIRSKYFLNVNDIDKWWDSEAFEIISIQQTKLNLIVFYYDHELKNYSNNENNT